MIETRVTHRERVGRYRNASSATSRQDLLPLDPSRKRFPSPIGDSAVVVTPSDRRRFLK
jgi:hypothetical protein